MHLKGRMAVLGTYGRSSAFGNKGADLVDIGSSSDFDNSCARSPPLAFHLYMTTRLFVFDFFTKAVFHFCYICLNLHSSSALDQHGCLLGYKNVVLDMVVLIKI